MRTGAPWPRNDLVTLDEIEEILRCIVQAQSDIEDFMMWTDNPKPFEERIARLKVIQEKLLSYLKERRGSDETKSDGEGLRQGEKESEPVFECSGL